MSRMKWGILGTGKIARRFAESLKKSNTGVLYGVASRDAQKAGDFMAANGGEKSWGSYQALLDDPEVEAVYIAVPHPGHAEWILKSARAGKHILCEKPATMNAGEMEAALRAVKEGGVFFMEAFMYRTHPQTQSLVDLLRSGEIGEVKLIQCTFSFDAGYQPDSRLFANRLGGGGIMDVGCYCASMARLVAGVALGGTIAEPLEVKGMATLDPGEKTDLLATAELRFEKGILAQLNTGVQLSLENAVRIHGSRGRITVHEPWFAGTKGAKIVVEPRGGEARVISTESDLDLYGTEIDLVAKFKGAGQAPFPAPGWDDTLGNMRLLDAWRKQAGVVYEADGKSVNA